MVSWRGGLRWIALFIWFSQSLANCEERIDGRVLSEGRPIAQAVVRIQGREQSVLSDDRGNFTIPFTKAHGDSLYITAGHVGFYNNRVAWKPGSPASIDLTPLPPEDNTSYEWQEPRPDPAHPDNCGNCHTDIYRQWTGDAHATAASNPMVITMYTGADADGHSNRGPGYKRDWNDDGNCATCHAPAGTTGHGMTINLMDLEPKQKEGVLCDFCHKIREVPNTNSSPNVADLLFLRPASGKKLLFGPFPDSTFPEEIPDFSYSPLFKSSKVCAACHEGQFWGVPAYETFSEWKESSYSRSGIQCQSCHMRPTGVMTHFTNLDKGGKIRDPATIGDHGMMGANREEFIRRAVEMKVAASLGNDLLTVKVTIVNTGAGHKIPTGQPMRNLILTVEPTDDAGRALRLVSGERVPIWGGSGKDANDYAGWPGKGFSKVLETLSEYQKVTIVNAKEVLAEFPAPMWRRTRIKSDTRIPPDGEDESTYVFLVPSGVQKIQVNSRLIYRRAYKPLADAKHWNIPDVVLRSDRVELNINASRIAVGGNPPDRSKDEGVQVRRNALPKTVGGPSN